MRVDPDSPLGGSRSSPSRVPEESPARRRGDRPGRVRARRSERPRVRADCWVTRRRRTDEPDRHASDCFLPCLRRGGSPDLSGSRGSRGVRLWPPGAQRRPNGSASPGRWMPSPIPRGASRGGKP
jgi:hypothetical protein